jgi:gas vesicle protein
MNTKDFLIGTFVGGIIGAAAALFLAPKSGKELRDDLGNQAVVLKDKTGKLTSEARERGSEYISTPKRRHLRFHSLLPTSLHRSWIKSKTCETKVLKKLMN